MERKTSKWCYWWDLNPHLTDFKSVVSADCTTVAYIRLYLPKTISKLYHYNVYCQDTKLYEN